MSTFIKRRTQADRIADAERTVALLRNIVADVRTAEQDGLLYCGSIRLATRRTPWLQVGPGVMALWWPGPESPHVVLHRDVSTQIPIRVIEWSDDDYVLVSFDGAPEDVAVWIDQVFQVVYGCRLGYDIDVELSDLTPASD